jgi:hypothetical protein
MEPEELNCQTCSKQFSRITYLKNHLQSKRHIENSKRLKTGHGKLAGKTEKQTEDKTNTETIDNSGTEKSLLDETNLGLPDENSVVPNQIYPALLQKRALELYKKEMAARRLKRAAEVEAAQNSGQIGENINSQQMNELIGSKEGELPAVVSAQVSKYNCAGCAKGFANKSNLNRHEKTCADAIELKEELFAKHKKGKHSSNRTKKGQPQLSGNITININIDNSQNTNTNNTNNTQNIWNQVNMNPFGYEDISILQNKQVIDKIHGRGLNAFDELLNQIYSLPSNRNIAITNQRKNLAKYINANGEVKITDQEKLLNDLVMNNVDILDEFLAKTVSEIDPRYKRTIDLLMSQHDLEDNPNISRYISFAYFLMLNITEDGLKNIGKFKKKVDEYINNNLMNTAPSGSYDAGLSVSYANNPKLAGLFKLPQSVRRINP